MQVTAWELEYHDDYANSHKYYRLYVLPNSYMVQWGRFGTTGQFKVTPSNNPSSDAAQQSWAKENKGYEPHGSRLVFDVNESWTRPDTRTAQLALSTLFDQAWRDQTKAKPQAMTPTQRLDNMQATLAQQREDKERQAEDKLKATLLRITAKADSAEATEAPDNNSMEAKLAAAMARAKESR